MAELKIKDYTEELGDDVVSKTSVLNGFDFTDPLDMDTDFDGVPAEKLLFRGMQIRKKSFEDLINQGIWIGIDSDGLGKINMGDGTDYFIVEDGQIWVSDMLTIGDPLGTDFIQMGITSPTGISLISGGSQTLGLDSPTGEVRLYDNGGALQGSIRGQDITGVKVVIIDDSEIVVLNGANLVVNSGVAVVAGGEEIIGMTSSSVSISVGSGAPTISAAKGSIYLRTDGTTTNDRAYINTNGGSTWTAIITAA